MEEKEEKREGVRPLVGMDGDSLRSSRRLFQSVSWFYK